MSMYIIRLRSNLTMTVTGLCSTQLNCTIAIDFTYSNGVATLPESLHFHRPPQQPSQYARALCAVGEIIQDYDR